MENTATIGKTTQQLEEELIEITRDLATSIKNLVHAQRTSPSELAKAAKITANLIPKISNVAKESAGTMTSLERQQQQLNLSKSVAGIDF